MNVTIIGRKNCQWCRKARKLAREIKADHVDYKDLEAPANAPLRRWFEMEKIKTVPQIFVDGKIIGGYEEFEKYVRRVD